MSREIAISVDDLLQGDLWRRLVRYRAGYRCEECGFSEDDESDDGRVLEAHHVDGDSTNHRLHNGMCLCTSCHARVTWTGRKHSQETIGKIKDGRKLEIGVDPGGTTGISWRCAGNGTRGTLSLPEDRAMNWITRKIEKDRVKLLVSESILIHAETHKKGQEVQASIRQIGVLQHWCRWHDVEFLTQAPSDAKNFGTDSKLRAIGWWTEGSDHARDASRHLLTVLCDRDMEFRKQVLRCL